MSGTYNDQGKDIDVPPTLVSFAVDIAKLGDIMTPESTADKAIYKADDVSKAAQAAADIRPDAPKKTRKK